MTRKASDSARGVPSRRCSAPRNQAGAGPSNTQRLSTSRDSTARIVLSVAACVSAAPCDHHGFKLMDERRGCCGSLSWTPDHIFAAARIILCKRSGIAQCAVIIPVACYGAKKSFACLTKGKTYGRTWKRSYSSLNILARGETESTPRRRRDARQPAAPAGRLAQRLRGVVVDGAVCARPKRALLATRR